MRFSQTMTIPCAPESVFRWIEDPRLASRWQPEVAGYEIIRVTPGRVGTEFRELLEGPGGSLEMRGRVTAYVPGERMGFDLDGRGIRVRACYAVAPVPAGTELRVDTDIRVGGRLWWLLAPLVRQRMARRLRAELELLRGLCQADAERR